MTDARAQRVITSNRVVTLTLISSFFSLFGIVFGWPSEFFWIYALCAGFGLVMTGIQLKLQHDVLLSTDASAIRPWLQPVMYTSCAAGAVLFATGIAMAWTHI